MTIKKGIAVTEKGIAVTEKGIAVTEKGIGVTKKESRLRQNILVGQASLASLGLRGRLLGSLP
jgi:hypothetical protein